MQDGRAALVSARVARHLHPRVPFLRRQHALLRLQQRLEHVDLPRCLVQVLELRLVAPRAVEPQVEPPDGVPDTVH